MDRKLTLRKETLVALTTDELADVVGAALTQCTVAVADCLPATLTVCPDFYCTGTI